MNVPDDLRYTEEHEWLHTLDDGTIRVGITDYAQDQLGDVVFVELSEVGTDVDAGAMLAEVESTKSVAEVYAPLAGSVVTINERLVEEPELVNQDPYGEGWFVTLRPSAAVDEGTFLDAEAYKALVG